MTPTVCPSCIIPEFTNPTNITVTADEDCIATVIPAPSISPFIGLEVMVLRVVSNLPPASFSKPDDISVIPYRNMARPPSKDIIQKISICLSCKTLI